MGMTVDIFKATPSHSGVRIVSISPTAKHILICSIITPINGYEAGDLFLYTVESGTTTKLISQTSLHFHGWSHSERFILVEYGIVDTELKKLYTCREYCSQFSANYIWSRVDDSLIYSDVDGSKNIYKRAKISENGLTTNEETLAGIAALLGPAFETLERRSGLMASRSYNTDRDLLISPDGQRVIFQGLRFYRYDWTPSGEDVCVTLLMGKDHLLQRTRTSSMRNIEWLRWLDNRYVIGRLEADGDDSRPEDRPLMLWNTNTGMVWKAPYPSCKPGDHLQFLKSIKPAPIGAK